MNRLFENWRKYIAEETAAFHGYGMEPEQMRVDSCNEPGSDDEEHGWADEQWSREDDGHGCPDFSNDRGIGMDHPDIQQAVQYLDNIMANDDTLIAYSRGGAIALAALSASRTQPFVIFVAPAWHEERGWVQGLNNPTYSNGVIVHGTKDAPVPIWHSAQLSINTGMPLYAFAGLGHVNILKHKTNYESPTRLYNPKIEEDRTALEQMVKDKTNAESV